MEGGADPWPSELPHYLWAEARHHLWRSADQHSAVRTPRGHTLWLYHHLWIMWVEISVLYEVQLLLCGNSSSQCSSIIFFNNNNNALDLYSGFLDTQRCLYVCIVLSTAAALQTMEDDFEDGNLGKYLQQQNNNNCIFFWLFFFCSALFSKIYPYLIGKSSFRFRNSFARIS